MPSPRLRRNTTRRRGRNSSASPICAAARASGGLVSAEEQETAASGAAVASSTLAGARAALDLAQLNFARSVVAAPVDGFVTHLRLQVGDYATPGVARLAVIDAHSFWVTGYFEETKLARIHPGDPARIRLMGYTAPLTGHVESIGRGIADVNDAVTPTGLPAVNPIFTWVRLAQRIPVRIAIDRVPAAIFLAAGETASVGVGPEATGTRTGRGRLIGWIEDHL